jgi:cupin 2 domain-containing protein
MIRLENIFNTPAPKNGTGETVRKIKTFSRYTRIELIRSMSPDNPSKGWYNEEDELVYLAKGFAELEFMDVNVKESRTVQMKEGDILIIPAHSRHRVTKVAPDTYWLAFFYKK